MASNQLNAFLKITNNNKYLVKQTESELEISSFRAEIIPKNGFMLKIVTKNDDAQIIGKDVICIDGEITAFNMTNDLLFLATENKNFYLIDMICSEIIANLKTDRKLTIIEPFEQLSVIASDAIGDVYKIEYDPSAKTLKKSYAFGNLSANTSLAVSDDQKIIAVADKMARIKLFHSDDFDRILSFCFGHKLAVNKMVFATNNNLISGGRDGLIFFWDFSDETKNAKIIGGYDLIRRKNADFGDIEKIKEESTNELFSLRKGINILRFDNKSNVLAVSTFEKENRLVLLKIEANGEKVDFIKEIELESGMISFVDFDDENGKVCVYNQNAEQVACAFDES